MARNIVYFDLETQRSAGDVGGWDKKDRMGMSVGVTYSTKLGEYRIYPEKRVDDLVERDDAALEPEGGAAAWWADGSWHARRGSPS
mgnify:CR=1 FL=1